VYDFCAVGSCYQCQAAVIGAMSYFFPVNILSAVCYDMVRYTLEQRVFVYDTYVKYGSAGKCRRKFRRKFHGERVPSRQTIHHLVNKLRTGFLIDRRLRRS
jgi:hypothetical protein